MLMIRPGYKMTGAFSQATAIISRQASSPPPRKAFPFPELLGRCGTRSSFASEVEVDKALLYSLFVTDLSSSYKQFPF